MNKGIKALCAFFVICLFITGCQQGITEGEDQSTMDFIKAAEKGDTKIVLELISTGVDLNATDDKGRTAIMAATHGNKPETVKALIEAGADINKQDNKLDNPYLYSGAEGFLDVLKLTIDAGANVKLTNRYGGTALIPASEHGYVEVVKELLTRTKVDVNHVNNLGWTALMEAIVLNDGGTNQQQVIKLLIEHGADVNIADKEGVSPLQQAKNRGFEQIVLILEKAGAQ